MPVITIRSDGVLERVAAKLQAAPSWFPQVYERHMPMLDRSVERIMYGLIEPNRYTGALQNSIQSEYDGAKKEVSIFPTAQRGPWDGGAILEMGTAPHTPPWAPIAAWAESKGLPAFPIWYSITQSGTKAHPFLDRTRDDYQTVQAIDLAATNITADSAEQVVAP